MSTKTFPWIRRLAGGCPPGARNPGHALGPFLGVAAAATEGPSRVGEGAVAGRPPVVDTRESRLPERAARWVLPLAAASIVLVGLTLIAAFWYAPTLTDRACEGPTGTGAADCIRAPMAQKLFYFHVPSAFASYGALAVMALAAGVFLFGRRHLAEWAHLARAAVTVGVLFATVTLATGMLWGAAEWGRPWDWTDRKLVLTLVMWLIYVAYLVLDGQLRDHPKRHEVVASYGVLGFISVPLSYLAQGIVHPQVLGPAAEARGGGISDPHIWQTLLLGVAAFLLLAIALILIRFLLELAKEEPETYELGGPQ